MKKFLFKLFVFLSITITVHLVFAFSADNSLDDYYGKVSNGTKKSLVIGTSRALQGIIPSIVDSTLENEESSLYNFAFTLLSSPFGEVYYNAIESKVSPNSTNGIFIVTVDPWSISQGKHYIPNDSIDKKSVLFGLSNLTSNPNFEYLWEKYPSGWGDILLRKLELHFLEKNAKNLNDNVTGSFSKIENDGWLNVYTSMDPSFVNEKENKKFRAYHESSKSNKFSEYRYSYLLKTIKKLKNYGSVYLVRLPVHKKMFEIESNYMPSFTSRIEKAINYSDDYFDMTKLSFDFKYTDGNHLEKSSSKKVSIIIANWIEESNKSLPN